MRPTKPTVPSRPTTILPKSTMTWWVDTIHLPRNTRPNAKPQPPLRNNHEHKAWDTEGLARRSRSRKKESGDSADAQESGDDLRREFRIRESRIQEIEPRAARGRGGPPFFRGRGKWSAIARGRDAHPDPTSGAFG